MNEQFDDEPCARVRRFPEVADVEGGLFRGIGVALLILAGAATVVLVIAQVILWVENHGNMFTG